MVYHDKGREFEYSAEWYDNDYHRHVAPELRVNPGPGDYVQRDLACLNAMGIQPGDRILIPGCGGGHNISLILSTFKDVRIVGFDWSETVLEFVRAAFPSVTFLRMASVDMEFDREFDRVVAIDFTEHLCGEHYEAFLTDAYDALRPGGTMGVVPGMTIRPEHIHLLTPGEIYRDMMYAGFQMESRWNGQSVVGRRPE